MRVVVVMGGKGGCLLCVCVCVVCVRDSYMLVVDQGENAQCLGSFGYRVLLPG